MELAKKLQANGWYLTEEGIKTIRATVGDEADSQKIIDEALNRDLRDIAGGALPNKRDDGNGTLTGRIVLQVQRVRNVAAPKSNEESKAAPRLLFLELSDGQASIQALELEPVPTLNLNIAPGTKIYFKAEKLQLMQGFLLIKPNDLQILGGRVEALYEKWEFARTMLKYARSGRPPSGATAPPPWVAFGKSIEANADKNFKSIALPGDTDKPSKENDEFNTMRNEAIAVASKAAVKKVFGGGGQYIVDHNIKKILEKGYSKEEAKTALQATRNNLERALYNLKRRRDAASGQVEPPVRGGRGERSGRDGKRGASLKDEAEAAKPAANATLFDFLTTKLRSTDSPATDVAETAKTTLTAEKSIAKQYESESKAAFTENKFQNHGERSRFENNVSSSFAANRGGHSARASRGGGRNRPVREERPARGSGNNYNERSGAISSGSGNMRKPETNSRASEQAHAKNPFRTGPHDNGTNTKTVSEGKPENDSSLVKEQGNNRRGNDRQQYRNGNTRAENGIVSNNQNNRRRQHGNGTGGGSVGGAAGKSVNSYTSNQEVFNTRLSKVVEETSNLKLGAPKREPRRGGRQSGATSNRQQSEPPSTSMPISKSAPEKTPSVPRQRQPQPDNARQLSNASYSQLPNGYTYDPSKIMGFQSKEANEFAMNLLKSQGLAVASTSQAPAPSSPKSKDVNSFSAQKAPTVPQVVANPQPATISSPPINFGVTPSDAWAWNAYDLCMAKYWDDGQYYEAQITGVAEKTCVVFFLGYGNHEEVLKSDILPITDSQNRPLTNMPQPQQHPQQQQSRYRNERQAHQQQVYVPPHKREY